ncbi:MAG TPA: type II toxin-antitoxin system VapC family toxin [Amycolatopsis sp.]|nr:type II toxin-antitoxin system VapC family toxin [Amycolatopsis sp.]
MGKYVIGPDVAIRLAEKEKKAGAEHELLAPAVLRSHVLALLYARVRQGEVPKEDADRRLAFIRGLRIRLLGDRVLQDTAWRVAEELGWADTYTAEYVALTRLHGDALVTLDKTLARELKGVVPVAGMSDLS